MIDAGDFTPASAVGPTRTGGRILLGRLTTTEEQRLEAISHLTAFATQKAAVEIRATVHWSRGEATVLTLTLSQEHLPSGDPVYLPSLVTETLPSGAVVPQSELKRLDRLKLEAMELHEKGML